MARFRTVLALALAAFVLTAGALLVPRPGSPAPAQAAFETSVRMEWLGWSHFRFTTPDGKTVLLNPFVNNPDSPVKVEDMTKADLIMVPNGHSDEIGQTIEIAQATGARVVAPFELALGSLNKACPQPR